MPTHLHPALIEILLGNHIGQGGERPPGKVDCVSSARRWIHAILGNGTDKMMIVIRRCESADDRFSSVTLGDAPPGGFY